MKKLSDLRTTRLKKGISQTELSMRTGLSQVQISSIERGKSFPQRGTMQKIEDGLNQKIDWLAHLKRSRPEIFPSIKN